jgi:nucleotide-binding universal stress UspA family protein
MVGRPGDEQRSLSELIRENAQKDMDEFLAGVVVPAGVRASHRLLSGEPASTLLDELKKNQHDLVVLGTHGRTGITHLIMGSVAEKLVRHSPIAVLTIPARAATPA